MLTEKEQQQELELAKGVLSRGEPNETREQWCLFFLLRWASGVDAKYWDGWSGWQTPYF